LELIIGKYAGMCQGSKFAVEKAKKILEENEKVYCLGEILHNRQVVEDLEKRGMITVDDIKEIPNYSKVIFRAHGEPKETYERAFRKGLEVFDLTCGNVQTIHNKVEKEKKKSFIIIIGDANHPEVIATKGFAGENSYVIDDADEILDAYMEYEKTNLDFVYVVGQTTFSSKKFDELSDEIRENFAETIVMVDKTICSATEKRQSETKDIAKQVDSMVIIGGKNSSNSLKLVEIAKENCSKVYFAQTKKDLKKMDFINDKKVGIMAGASTPNDVIEEVKSFLEKIK
jgi:4-hydroxy-3-methylbut-2-enyl diphosphate reductase